MIENNPIVTAIEAGISTVASAGETLDPALAPFIVIGQAAAAALPELIDDVTGLLSGAQPSDADKAALAAKIQALANPASD